MKTREYWESKHPLAPISYCGRRLPDGSMSTEDVRHFLTDKDNTIFTEVAKVIEGRFSTMPQDEKAWRLQQWVASNIRYVSDGRFKAAEWWLYPWETFALMSGDCEDGANLLASMMLIAGCDRWRVRPNAGLVVADPQTAATGGHAWVSYIRESDNEVVYLDWCYYQDSPIHVADKPLGKDRKEYFGGDKIWWSYTIDNAYAHESTSIFGRVKSDRRLSNAKRR